MADYLLRDVPDHLWKLVKVQAATDGKPIRTVLVELLTDYAWKEPKARAVGPKLRKH